MINLLPDVLRRELELANDWKIERGTKHNKLIVRGKFCGIVPRDKGGDAGRVILNIRSQVRRARAQ